MKIRLIYLIHTIIRKLYNTNTEVYGKFQTIKYSNNANFTYYLLTFFIYSFSLFFHSNFSPHILISILDNC